VLLASNYDKSRFLKSEDLTQEKKFRIKTVTEEEVGEKKEKKLVVWFTNDERGLVLNRINNRAIRGAFGDNTADWSAKIIAVLPTMAEFRGKMGPAPHQPHRQSQRHRQAMARQLRFHRQQRRQKRRRLRIQSSSLRRSQFAKKWTTRFRFEAEASGELQHQLAASFSSNWNFIVHFFSS
jgi:hypothetical protein